MDGVIRKEQICKRSLQDLNVVPKIWGYEKWLENNAKYCCKLLSVNKGFQSSLHYHKIKDEMFLIIKGCIRLELQNKIIPLQEGDFIRILSNALHRFTAVENSELIEVSTHHDDEDCYRLEPSMKCAVRK